MEHKNNTSVNVVDFSPLSISGYAKKEDSMNLSKHFPIEDTSRFKHPYVMQQTLTSILLHFTYS